MYFQLKEELILQFSIQYHRTLHIKTKDLTFIGILANKKRRRKHSEAIELDSVVIFSKLLPSVLVDDLLL